MTARSFIAWLNAAEFHWFFTQAEQAHDAELYLPACIGLVNGVEASIRFTLTQVDRKELFGDLGATLSNPLLSVARDRGLPIHTLAFPGEIDFNSKLASKQPHVEIVRLRHNLAHGNITEFVNTKYGFFTPECLRDLSGTLLTISREWARQLGDFRKKHIAVRR